MNNKKQNFFNNSSYAIDGFRALIKEKSFLLELSFLPLLIIFLYVNSYSIIENIIIFGAYTSILLAEGFNTAIETVVDLVTIELNPQAKKAKDIGSAAVLFAICNFLIVFFSILFFNLNNISIF